MSLPWVRLDANIGTHDKTLSLLGRKDGHKAFTLYVCALGWAGGHGTDGFIPTGALPVLHGTPRLADLLVAERLWEQADNGWWIRNYAHRQELEVVTAAKRAAQRIGAAQTNCRRYHGPDCGCWKERT